MLWVLSTRVAQLINRVITYSMYTGFTLSVALCVDLGLPFGVLRGLAGRRFGMTFGCLLLLVA